MQKLIFCQILLALLFKTSVADGIIDEVAKQIVLARMAEIKEESPEEIAIPTEQVTIPKNDYLYGNLSVSNFKVNGFKEFSITHLEFTKFNFSFSYLINNLNFYTDYKNDWIIGDTHTVDTNKGHIKMDFKNIVFEGNGRVDYSYNLINGKLVFFVPEVESVLSIESATFDITGILNDEELSKEISDGLTKYVAKAINEYQQDISPAVNAFVLFYINAVVIEN